MGPVPTTKAPVHTTKAQFDAVTACGEICWASLVNSPSGGGQTTLVRIRRRDRGG